MAIVMMLQFLLHKRYDLMQIQIKDIYKDLD